jgi:hypothetical protein
MKPTKLINLKGESQTILIEAVCTDDEAIQATSGALIGKTIDNTLEGAIEKIKRLASSFSVLELPKQVAEAGIEMGFQFDAKGTIYLVSSTATASIKLTLKLSF